MRRLKNLELFRDSTKREKALARAYLGLGSNLGDRRAMIEAAVSALARTPGLTLAARSHDYETPPWGDTEQGAFVNACVAVDTVLAPQDLLAACLAVERALGRVREAHGRRWGPRLIDIDVLAYEGETLASPELTLPHPRMLERAFVLVPLAEIAPDLTVAGTPLRLALGRLDASAIEPLPD